MKAREANLDDKAAVIELWERCGLTRPWNDPSQDFDFAHAGPSSAVIALEAEGAIIDLSPAAAKKIDIIKRGQARVKLEVLAWGNGELVSASK